MEGCLLRGDQVMVPSSLRQKFLNAIHVSHHGILRTKSAARSYVWWPGLNKDVEKTVQVCSRCKNLTDVHLQLLLHHGFQQIVHGNEFTLTTWTQLKVAPF